MKKKVIIGSIIVAAIIVVIVLFKACSAKEQKISIETVKVKIGTVSNTVTATGTIEAIKTVTVGTQVSGEIRKIYVDYNSQVKAGQILAELDRAPLTTALTIAEAALDEAKAEKTYQTANFNRVKALSDKKLVAESDYDLALYTYQQALTNFKTAQLNYDKAKINLGYAYIYSPIDGVVINRAVDEGQTVAASYSTPTLFSIANDLTRMQVEASIDEADIGQIKDKQRVEFTVDAYPEQKFAGTVTQIRLQPTTTSNVVTYTVIVEAPNQDKKLMPGMTASITVFTEEANNVLTVASKALRFKPDSLILAEYLKKNEGKEITNSKPKEPQALLSENTGKKGTNPTYTSTNNTSTVWIKVGNDIHEAEIQTGINNDIDVHVLSGLKEGDEVLISLSSETSASATSQTTTSSPFMPKPPSRTSTKKK